MKPLRFQSEVLEVKRLTHTVKHISLSIPLGFRFVPGQYISIILDNKERRLRRPYSIASKPGRNSVDFCIKIIPHGLATPIIDKLNKGDKIELLGPLGEFAISEASKNKDLVFVSTGTGVGPFRSMIPWLLESGFNKEIKLIAGYRSTILYDGEFKELERKYKNFVYKSVLSPKRVQDLLEEIETGNNHFYLCGLKDMINSVKMMMLKRGVPMSSIYSEKYD